MVRWRTVMLAALALMVFGCAGHLVYKSGPYSGRVIDAETKQPLAGAVVLAVWSKYVPVGGHMPEKFVDAVEVTTDANGEFQILRKEHVVIWGSMGEPRIIIFFPGYGFYPKYHVSPSDGASESLRTYATIELPRWTTREERLRKLESLTNPVSGVPTRRMPKLVESFRAEERALGVQPQSIGR